MALIGKVRAMRLRDGKSISEIARLTSVSRNTVKKWLKARPGAVPKYQRREMPTKLTPFMAALTQALEADAQRAKHERAPPAPCTRSSRARATTAATRG